MKIYVDKLTNFNIGHGEEAEFAIQNTLARLFNLRRGPMTFGYASNYDFMLNNTSIELKISSKVSGTLELGRADGGLSGISVTTADVYLFLNPSGEGVGKLRAIRTAELKQTLNSISANNCTLTKTVGNKVGSMLTFINFKDYNDIMLAEFDCYPENGTTVFDTDTVRTNQYARKFVNQLIK